MRIRSLSRFSILFFFAASSANAQNAVPKSIPAPQTSPSSTVPVSEFSKFDLVERAGRNLEGATSVGIEFSDYRRLVQAFAGELSALTARLSTDSEKECADLYAEVLSAHKFAIEAWSGKRANTKPYASQYRSETPEAFRERLKRYDEFEQFYDDAIQHAWMAADLNLKMAANIRAGEPAVAGLGEELQKHKAREETLAVRLKALERSQ